LLDRVLHLRFVADVDDEGQRFAAGFADFLGRREDRPGQLGVRLVGLGGDRDVGAVARRAQRNREADAARGASNKERAVF